ncbi:MAG: hypothetical protein L0215_02015 [Gemmataceae bacterium]|nr:hypothetical protein [Gemmataceae bacterium]
MVFRKLNYPPTLEILEDRTVPATLSWDPNPGGAGFYLFEAANPVENGTSIAWTPGGLVSIGDAADMFTSGPASVPAGWTISEDLSTATGPLHADWTLTSFFRFNLRDEADYFDGSNFDRILDVMGGPGNDIIYGGTANDLLNGGFT